MTSTLSEIRDTRQIPGEPRRRWFASANLDLVMWFGDDAALVGFQLCYDKQREERALTWHANGSRFTHEMVDDGESAGLGYKATPVLVRNGALNARRLLAAFLAEAGSLPQEITQVVARQLEMVCRECCG